MKVKNPKAGAARGIVSASPHDVVEDIMTEKLEHMTTVLCQTDGKKSQLYNDLVTILERSLFKIALKRNNHIKSHAADYLGINRNTFQKKLIKLGIENNVEP